MKINHSQSIDTWNNNEIKSIQKVLKSKYLTLGKKVKEFKQKFSNYIGAKYSVMVNSGSSANLLMMASLFFTRNKKYKLKKVFLEFNAKYK